MVKARPPYWFAAKRYGWGWGLPLTWQGWVVLVGWIAVVTAVSPFLAPRSTLLFALFVVLMSLVLTAICFTKGEPPRWRWGGTD
jgi:hypothetical protein